MTPQRRNTAAILLPAVRAQVVAIVETLFTRKVMQRLPQVFWQDNGTAAFDNLQTALLVGADVNDPGTVAALTADLQTYVNAMSPNLVTDAYDHDVAALTDPTMVAVDVVRSGNFAQHGPTDKAFAFEDRAEVADTFPALTATYDRIVALVDRY